MKIKILIFALILLIGIVNAEVFENPTSGIGDYQYQEASFQSYYSSSDIDTYWPIINDMKNGQCEATSDFIVNIRPGSCEPTVVRSDLLAEQNVAVFCQLDAIQINPLIQVSYIKSISFKGERAKEVAGISFHPARAALRSYNSLLGSPVLNNIGYVVIVLKRQPGNESNLPEWVSGNLTATIYYDAEEAYGVGRGEYFAPEMTDEEWNSNYKSYGFWYGKGYVRVNQIEDGGAKVSLYSGKDKLLTTLSLKEGETSNLIYFPGFYCKAGLKVRLNDIVSVDKQAKLSINGEDIWVRVGSKIVNNQCTVSKIIPTVITKPAEGKNPEEIITTGSVEVNCHTKKMDLILTENSGGAVDAIYDGDVDGYFGNADKEDSSVGAVNELVSDYPYAGRTSVYTDSESYIAENALIEEIELAKTLKKFDTASKLIELFEKNYASSDSIEKIKEIKENLGKYNYEHAGDSIYLNGKTYSVFLEQIKDVDQSQKSVTISVNNADNTVASATKAYKESDSITLNILDKESIKINKIDVNGVELIYYNDAGSSTRQTLSEGDSIIFDNKYDVVIRDLNVKTSASISIIPEIDNTKTDANFSFRIGIEKRAIELTPEKALKEIQELNETIQKLDDINQKLGNTIKAWKGACFATSGVLMLKSWISGMSGGSMARTRVMETYKIKCQQETGTGKQFQTSTACYNFYADPINKDVAAYTAAIKSTNDNIKAVEANSQTDGFLGLSKVVDSKKALIDYKTSLRNKYGESVSVLIDGEIKVIKIDSIETFEQAKAIETAKSLPGISSEFQTSVNSELADTLRPVYLRQQESQDISSASSSLTALGIKNAEIESLGQETLQKRLWGGQKYDATLSSKGVSADVNTPIQYVTYQGATYLLVLQGSGEVLETSKIYRLNENNFNEVQADQENYKAISQYGFIQSSPCENKYTNAKVRFYDSGDNSKMPAIVPFDLSDGWYAYVPQTTGGILSSSQAGYQSSGDVSYFHICNVGENGLEESRAGDDNCQSFDINTYQTVQTFGGCSLSATGVQDLAARARNAIRQAANQYGQKQISISGVGTLLDADSYIGGQNTIECQDFMSPEDCKLMFNVCDPVICPASRCNYGGKYQVDDVVASGIVGSIFLCLPNINEGVVVPICLTGIHAGLDSWVQILKQKQKCLQENVETGQYTGICDEITAIYQCEFFWRQAAPLVKMVIPSIIEFATGNNVRGGGEYLTVKDSWNTLEKSVSYFKNTYAPNVFRAFQMRSIEDVGSEVCRNYIGTSVPTSAEMLDNLLEPESPTQFYAQFSEIPFTDATVPATSQYKVYYHIYAGNDIGVQYTIYLKNPPATAYYTSAPQVVVKSGYIPRGESVDEATDFTAPAGYKELCVVTNQDVHCGFKQVTTSFALDYLSDKYVEQQAEEKITTEKECISGSPSVLALVNPNVQEGVDEAINPQISTRGIVRVCAKNNPGIQVELQKTGNVETTSSRWKEVGYCEDSSIKCWLDTESVEDSIDKVYASTGNLKDSESALSQLEQAELSEQDTQTKLDNIEKEIKELDIKDTTTLSDKITAIKEEIESIIKLGGSEEQGAQAVLLKVKLYNHLILDLQKAGLKEEAQVDTQKKIENPTTTVTTPIFELKNNVIYYNGAETNLLVESSGGASWLIYYKLSETNRIHIGDTLPLKSGEISFNNNVDQIPNLRVSSIEVAKDTLFSHYFVIETLKHYKLSNDRKFSEI